MDVWEQRAVLFLNRLVGVIASALSLLNFGGADVSSSMAD